MIKDDDMHMLLDQMITDGERINFVDGKAESKGFEQWTNRTKEFLLTVIHLTEEKIERKFYHNDESYFNLLIGYLRKISLDNSGIW